MSLISICNVNFDVDGCHVFEASNDSYFGEISRRVSRTKTLDGGASIEDLGYSLGDSEWSINVNDPQKDLVAGLKLLFELQPTITISSREGVFTASPSNLSEQNGKLTLKLIINQKVST